MPNQPEGLLRRRDFCAATIACSVFLRDTFAQEQWPRKPIKIVVAYPPGGIADYIARNIGNSISADLGVPVIVENKPGAGTNIGSMMVARSAPDGYTLLLATSTNAANVTLFKKLGYDPVRDFAPLSIIADANTALVTHPSQPFKDIKQLIAYAKEKPDELAFGSPGIGSPGHLAGELFKKMAGIRMRHVAYQGGPQSAQDVMGGTVPLAFINMNVVQPFVEAKRLRALAVTGAKRWMLLPDVPTIAEAGLPGYAWSSWMGLAAPAGTPAPVIERLSGAIQRARTDASAQAIRQQGADPVFSTPAVMGERLRADVKACAEVIKVAGIAPE